MNDIAFRPPRTVLLVHGSAVVGMGLRPALAADARVSVIGEATNGRLGLTMARKLRPDIVLLEHWMPHSDGLGLLPAFTSFAQVLVLAHSHDEATVTAAIRLGAYGFLVHEDLSSDELLRALTVADQDCRYLSSRAANAVFSHIQQLGCAQSRTDGGDSLSRREREIMEFVAQGLTNRAIAAALFLSEKTVKNHINHIFAKLQVRTRSEAMARWLGTHQPVGGVWDRQRSA